MSSFQQSDDDYEAVTRIFDTNSLFQCPLCKNDFQDPRILCSNGHTFCLNCIQNILPDDGILKCPICKEVRRFTSVKEIGQLTKNSTLQILKRAEHHRIAQIGICELCNKKPAYGRCFHCRSLACFKCMNEHEQSIADEQIKEYSELIKIRDKLNEKISQWDKKLTESKENIRKTIQIDVEKQIKEIQDHEQILYNQLDDLYQSYLLTKNIKLQKLKFDIEKESYELDCIDPKSCSISDRIRLNQYWTNLQRKFDDQSIDFIYNTNSSSIHRSYLGELHLKTINQEIEYLQRQKFNTSDNQHSLIPFHHSSARKQMSTPEQNLNQLSKLNYENENNSYNTIKFSTLRNHSQHDDYQIKQGSEYAIRKLIRNRQQQKSNTNINMKLLNEIDQQQIEDNTPLTPRMPIAPIHLDNYNKKARQILIGLNEADKFLAPKAIAMTDTNQLLITDTKKHRIIIYDLNLKTMNSIKGFLFPDGLCLAMEHYVIITDRHRISKYDWLHGKMISFIGSKKQGCTRSSFSWPKGITIDNNYVYVCDSYNSRMVVLTHQMRYENEWIIIRGTKKLDPQYTSISNSQLYVTAWQRIKPESCAYNAGCIIVYSTDGTIQRFIDTDAQSYLNLSVPEGIVCDSSNQLILADRYTSKILAMNNNNNDNQQSVIHFHGDKMKSPHYVCFSNDQNTMIVSDIGNNTIQFYEKRINTPAALSTSDEKKQ
ncbi:unnamed protein product [Rotaria sordida]|uniref:RING-type domain-containing protein n=1 Tax=Rotaria sordida TaxID=392033 RepID=A0A814PGC0_9BILA|nr:unnamed protein product [Rotaria sordida]